MSKKMKCPWSSMVFDADWSWKTGNKYIHIKWGDWTYKMPMTYGVKVMLLHINTKKDALNDAKDYFTHVFNNALRYDGTFDTTAYPDVRYWLTDERIEELENNYIKPYEKYKYERDIKVPLF